MSDKKILSYNASDIKVPAEFPDVQKLDRTLTYISIFKKCDIAYRTITFNGIFDRELCDAYQNFAINKLKPEIIREQLKSQEMLFFDENNWPIEVKAILIEYLYIGKISFYLAEPNRFMFDIPIEKLPELNLPICNIPYQDFYIATDYILTCPWVMQYLYTKMRHIKNYCVLK